MEVALVCWAVLVCLRLVNVDDVTDCRRGGVQVHNVNISGRSRLVGLRNRALDVPQIWRSTSPGRAHNWFSVAVEVGKLWCRWVGRENSGRFLSDTDSQSCEFMLEARIPG